MRFYLEKSESHLAKGLSYQQSGNSEKARFHLLKSAEFLFRAAEKSDGEQKKKRTAQAESILQKAQSIKLDGATTIGKDNKITDKDEKNGPRWKVQTKSSIRFSDVAGHEEVKEQIRVKLIYPFTHPEQAKKFGVKAGGGILLYGPPGTGKTLLARAVAGEVDAAFYAIKPSEIMSKWVGEAENNISDLFAEARTHERAVIFMDEVEALVPRRGSSGSTVMARVVPQILAELDGFDNKGGALLFIGATNEPWSLDEAILRPGRLDEKVYISLPDKEARLKILELNVKGRPLAADVDLEALVDKLAGNSGADIANICRKACDIPFIESVKTGNERDVCMSDLLTVANQVKPSVSQSNLKRFDKYRYSE
jgi:transitional endoplasmic reticulum ATPase